MKLKVFILIHVLSFYFLSVRAQKSGFKIVGYYSLHSALENSKNVHLNRLTHVNLWFFNPDTLGNFTGDLSALKSFVNRAHRKNVKVLFSIGGGGDHPYYHSLLKTGTRENFINNLLAEVLKYNIDGIDVDLEGSDIDENYESFVMELARALKSQNKLITAAIAVYYKDQLSDNVLAQYDFVNIMCYDRTGPWRPENPGPHSTYAHAVEDLDYFGTVRNIPRQKMTLGVPFYGYGFGPQISSPVISMDYREIVSSFPGSESKDRWDMTGGKIIYYNGIPTIMKKTDLAKEKAGGIMIWQIEGDARGSKSLLKAINKAAYAKK